MVTYSCESALSARDFELLLEGVQRMDKADQRKETQFAVFCAGRLGLRAGEIIHMTEDWIDWRNRRIEIPRQTDCHLGRGDGPCGYCQMASEQMVEHYTPEECTMSRKRERFISRQLDRQWAAGDPLTLADATSLRWFCKNENAAREVPFAHNPRAELAIERFFADRDGWNLSKSALNRRLNKALELADELDTSSTMPHGLRATAATHLAGKGIDPITLQSMLGWADMQTAQRYISESPKQTEQALQALGH